MSFIRHFIILGALFTGLNAQNNETHRVFPDGFLFGAATASYQVEGAWNVSDKGENIWDHLTHFNNIVRDGSSGDVACDSYNNYPRDVEMLKELGVDYYRISISWSRILPSGFDDKVSATGIAYYNNLINLLIENNITPVVTLYHWDLPQPLQDIGGWPNPMLEYYFANFARVAFENFGDRVANWLTFNEPFIVCRQGYGDVTKAPALNFQGIAEYLCGHTLLKAHARAYHLYDEVFRPTQKGRVGLTLNSDWHEPEDLNSAADVEASENALQFSVGWFAHPIFSNEGDYPTVMKEKIAARSQEQGYSSSRLPSFTAEEVAYIQGTFDFFGLNHYSSSMVKPAGPEDVFENPSYWEDLGITEYKKEEWLGSPSTDWLKVVPWGFRKLLVWLTNEYNTPEIIVFENGYSDLESTDDPDRVSYLHQYLNALLDAMEEGANITAYTVWSLMDNFEWMKGYTERYGIYRVDFNDPARTRTPRLSAKYYSEIVATRTIARV